MTRNILGTLALIGLFVGIAWTAEPEAGPQEARSPIKSDLERGCEVYERVWHVPCPTDLSPEPHYYPPRGEYLDI